MSGSLQADLNNPYLFKENKAGEYEYGENSVGGKYAEGALKFSDAPNRDAAAQSSAGGDSRRGKDHDWGADDGGHLIAARFGGAGDDENLTAQNRNLNRSSYKAVENDWASHLKNKEKVYVHMETSGGERPDAYMGYAIFEAEDGTRTYETYHFVNESKGSIEQWENDAEEFEADNPEWYEDMPKSENTYSEESDYVDLPETTENTAGHDADMGIDQSADME